MKDSNQLKISITHINILMTINIQDFQKLPFINCKRIENKDAAFDLFKNMFKTIVDQHAQ